jgi:LacI family transcriptional regulator
LTKKETGVKTYFAIALRIAFSCALPFSEAAAMKMAHSKRLRRMAKSGPAPTINDVARVAGVSKKTVSRVINRSPLLKQATREKVEKVIAELGYTPNPQARALALRRNFLLGLLHDNPNAQTVLNFQEGVLDAIRDTEFALVVRPVDRHSPAMLDDIRNFLEQQRLYGVLILPPISENDELAALCREMGCGYVRMGSAALDEAEQLVQSNDREMVEGVVDYLVELGHTLDQNPHVTAIFASNDEMAAGAYHAARERGVDIPRDLSIVGFDDSPIAAHIWPPMTTVGWPIREMGKAAALKLVSPDTAEAKPSCFPARLVTRNSVAPPSKKI